MLLDLQPLSKSHTADHISQKVKEAVHQIGARKALSLMTGKK
jgi:hypothetical protein